MRMVFILTALFASACTHQSNLPPRAERQQEERASDAVKRMQEEFNNTFGES